MKNRLIVSSAVAIAVAGLSACIPLPPPPGPTGTGTGTGTGTPAPTRNDVETSLRLAWGAEVRPDDLNIVYANKGHEECAQTRERLKGQAWQSLTPATLRGVQDSLPFLSPSGLRYFLPGYMLASLEPVGGSGGGPGNDLLPHVLAAITPPPAGSPAQKSYQVAFGNLTTDQRASVRQYVELARATRAADFPLGQLDAALAAWK